jgi:hypothetical protein
MTLVAIPGSLIISIGSAVVDVMCRVVPATGCLLILGYMQAILIAQWAQ